MRKPTRISLRNKCIHHLNNWQQLGCLVREYSASRHKVGKDRSRFTWRLITGVAKDGRAILLYPIIRKQDKVPHSVCRMMSEYEGRGAIVGCVENIGDAWDVVQANEKEYKRKARTYLHRYWLEKYKKSKEREDE